METWKMWIFLLHLCIVRQKIKKNYSCHRMFSILSPSGFKTKAKYIFWKLNYSFFYKSPHYSVCHTTHQKRVQKYVYLSRMKNQSAPPKKEALLWNDWLSTESKQSSGLGSKSTLSNMWQEGGKKKLRGYSFTLLVFLIGLCFQLSKVPSFYWSRYLRSKVLLINCASNVNTTFFIVMLNFRLYNIVVHLG